MQFAVVTTAGAAPLVSALNNTPSFAASLVTLLQLSSDAVLAGVTGLAITPPVVQTLALAAQPCAAGTFLNASSLMCETCAPGSFSPLPGAPSCQLCAPGTYSLNATYCLQCPATSTAPAGSSSLAVCLCPYGFYQAGISNTSSSFTCTPCPDGALCSGDATPLATKGFWHLPGDFSTFYACEDGYCLAEEPSSSTTARRLLQAESNVSASNCHLGHTGIVCSVCLDGYTVQGEFCEKCPDKSAMSDWPPSKLAGIIVMAVILFVVGTVTVMWSPVIIQPSEILTSFVTRLNACKAKLCGAPVAKPPPKPVIEQSASFKKVEEGALAAVQETTKLVTKAIKAYSFAGVPIKVRPAIETAAPLSDSSWRPDGHRDVAGAPAETPQGMLPLRVD